MKFKIISLSKAKAHLLELARHLDEKGESYVLTKDGEPVGALIPMDEYDAYLETIEIEENPLLMKELQAALEEERKGRLWKRDSHGKWIRHKKKQVA